MRDETGQDATSDDPSGDEPRKGAGEEGRDAEAAGSDRAGDPAEIRDPERAKPVDGDDGRDSRTESRTRDDADRAGDVGHEDGADPSSIDPAELTVAERSLHPRIRTLWIVRAVLWSLVLGAIAAGVDWQWLGIGPVVPAAVTAVALLLFVPHAILRYRAWQYEFREDAIYLERGVLTRVRTVVPFVRIQHVDTARGPIERVVGLSTLVVYTAGSRGADVTIPGIEAERARDHQRRLKQLAIAAEDDTAV